MPKRVLNISESSSIALHAARALVRAESPQGEYSLVTQTASTVFVSSKQPEGSVKSYKEKCSDCAFSGWTSEKNACIPKPAFRWRTAENGFS